MELTKKRWQSKTIIASLIGTISLILSISNVAEINVADQAILTDTALNVVGLIASVVAIRGRSRANKSIK